MKLELDFALDRTRIQHRRHWVLAVLGLVIGLQTGLGAWRYQSAQDALTMLHAQQRQQSEKNTNLSKQTLTADDIKVAITAQQMLDSMAVPWDDVLDAIEAARPPTVLVDGIEPRVKDSSVTIHISSPDFAQVSEFIDQLGQQELLHHVMLTSEAMPDNGSGVLRVVITAQWASTFPTSP
jgi:Tfp pilus assembly protein PilN